MNAVTDLREKAEEYLAERHQAGFRLRTTGLALASFARHVAQANHRGPLTVDLMADWARQAKSGGSGAAARRLHLLRSFAGWMRQFEPRTEIPDETIFGPIPGRVAPHIFRDNEIVQLLAAARQLPPVGGLRPVTYETLFGLLAACGLRIGEALALREADVDLKGGVLTIWQAKFSKSRLVPMHPSTVRSLASYRRFRNRHLPHRPETPFFVTVRGKRRGQPLGDRQVHRVFAQLRQQLGWRDRGGHGAPRIHDLRHSFTVRRLMLWHQQGADIDQQMLALSTYIGHAKITNTYWYLSAVPELVALAGAKFERFAAGGCDE